MAHTLWTDLGREEGIDLGDPFALLADFRAMELASGGDAGRWAELFAVPDMTIDDDEAGPEVLAKIAAQAHDFLARHGADLPPGARETLRRLAGAA